MENSNVTYLIVILQTVKPSSDLAAACFRSKAQHYYSTLLPIAPFASLTSTHRLLRIAASPIAKHQQVKHLLLPYEE